MAHFSTWMTSEELEHIEQRLRRLLSTPTVTAGVAEPNKSPGASRGGSMFTSHQPADALMDALRSEHVSYELFPHRHTESALAEAEVLHQDPRRVAKTLVLVTPFGYVRAVLRAVDRLDLQKARFALGTTEVELATEEDLVGAYPEFELGAVPPVGGTYDRVLVDHRVFDSRFVLFDAGTHDESIRLRTGDLLSLAEAEVADLALDRRESEEMP
jgi:Ala-tRNA(Pro) deacylase